MMPLPARPDLVLRIGFAGNRTLPADATLLEKPTRFVSSARFPSHSVSP